MSPPISDAAFWSRRLLDRVGPAHLVRIGENALWRAPESGLAIRLYRDETSTAKPFRELAVADMLAASDVPAIRPEGERITYIAGRPATLWSWIQADGSGVDPFSFGTLLRAAHTAWRRGVVKTEDWPMLDPISKIDGRMAGLTSLDEAPLLQQRLDEATTIWREFASTAPLQLIHGDAHSGNAIATPQGLFLADFDETKIGPIEWDLVSMMVGHLRFGRTLEDLHAFAVAMGATPAIIEGARHLAPVKELSALTWLGVHALEDTKARSELRRRLDLSSERQSTIWRPL